MNTENIKVIMEKGFEDLFPTKAHKNDAAYDLRADKDYIVYPGQTVLVKTGVVIELPDGYEAQIRPRSGLAFKNGITVLNTPGTIDAGYRNVIGVLLYKTIGSYPNVNAFNLESGSTIFDFFSNLNLEPFVIKRGDRIAQMVINKLPDVNLVMADMISGDSDRGLGGFGSTGVK